MLLKKRFKMMPDFKKRPNYYFFNLSILVYSCGLLLQGAWLPAFLCLAAAAIIHIVTRMAPADQIGKAEVWGYMLVMTFFFFGTTVTIPMIRPEVKYDQIFQAVDNKYFLDVETWVATVSRPWLTDVITFCYLLYGPLMYSSIIYYGLFRKGLGLGYFAGLFSIFGLGFLCYLALPAEGPHFARLGEVMPLIASGPFHTFADPLIKDGCTRSDAFPSLHIAVSFYTLIFMFFHSRRLFWCWLPIVSGLAVATVYLFYHYQIDVLAGFVVVSIAVALSRMVTADSPAAAGNLNLSCNQQ